MIRGSKIVCLFLITICIIGATNEVSKGNVKLHTSSLKVASSDQAVYLESKMIVSNFDASKAYNGINYFGLYSFKENQPGVVNKTYFTFTTLEGKVVHEPLIYNGSSLNQISWVNQSTVLADYNGKPLLWNIITNRTVIIDFGNNQHGDITFNPKTNTFIMIEYYIDSIINSTGQLQTMLFDQITEYNIQGAIVWKWKPSDWLNLLNISRYFQILNDTHLSVPTHSFEGQVYPYITQCQSIFWDTSNDYIYMDLGGLNKFIKILRGTNVPDLFIGENTEYKLLTKNGTQTNSLWYGSSDLTYLGKNKYLLFDNNRYNTTDISLHNNITALASNETLSDPVYNYTQSSLLVIYLNETDNTIRELFRWKAPSDWWTTESGSVQLLPNGNYLASFGSPIKGMLSNPLNSTHGGTAVEITPEGKIVWQLTLSQNWGFYRLYKVAPTTTVTPLDFKTVNVGAQVLLNFSDPFSNFPKSFRIVINEGTDYEKDIASKDWNNEPILYTVDTSSFAQGENFVSLYLKDQAGNEKLTSVEILVIYPKPSHTKKGPVFTISSVIPFLLVVIVLKKREKIFKFRDAGY